MKFSFPSPLRRLLVALAIAAALPACRPADDSAPLHGGTWLPLSPTDLHPSTPFRGTLEARNLAVLTVPVQGSAVLVDILPDGSRVAKGDCVARFDTSQLQQDLARQENDRTRARQERKSLESAELPLERLDLENQLAAAEADAGSERDFLDSLRGLADRGLVSPAEIARQEQKVADAAHRLDQMRRRLDLTTRLLHPARIAKARAAEQAAAQLVAFTKSQLDACTVRAPADGVLGLLPLSISGEWRVPQVGDTLFRNQAFLCIPAPGGFLLSGLVSEADLPSIAPGAPVLAHSPAFPDIPLRGTVESVGRLARSSPSSPRPGFPVRIALDSDATPADLPLGVSVLADVFSPPVTNVLAVPRAAVDWSSAAPTVLGRPAASPSSPPRRIPFSPGAADDSLVQILSGLDASWEIFLPESP